MSSPSRLAPTSPGACAIAAAGTAWVRDRLALPLHAATVVHWGPDAVYVDDGDHCFGVLSATAVGVPCGLRTTLAAIDATPLGSSALVGDGRLVLGGIDARIRRIVDAAVPTVGRLPDIPPAAVAHVRAALPAAALAALARGDDEAVPALLGLGEGLTPLGDDVLMGWLAGRRAIGAPRDPVATEVQRLARRRTTRLSATLLDCALHGDVLPQVRSFLATGTGLPALLAVGGTSGAGLALGLSLTEAGT